MIDEQDKRARRRRIITVNCVLLALWIGTTFFQAEMYERSRNELWMGNAWLALYFLVPFAGNLVAFRGSVLRRCASALLATFVLGLAWAGSLAFCAHVLGITYA